MVNYRAFTSLVDAMNFAVTPANTKMQTPRQQKHKKAFKKNKMPRNYFPLKKFRLDLETIYEDPRPWNSGDIRLLYSFIKNNDTGSFSEFIWKFPHLLYSTEALPKAEYEGAEYNLLQITVIFNAPVFCQLILDILEYPRFYDNLLPVKDDENYRKKINDVLRLYLNSALDENGDTPLHYASRFGLTDCCRILLSHPLCKKEKRNNEGFTPADVICLSANGRANPSFRDLQALFLDGMWYVPVFRSDENVRPIIGKPCEHEYFTAPENKSANSSKEEQETKRCYFLKAFAGPMSFIMALRVQVALKTPLLCNLFSHAQRKQMEMITNLEPNRGIERIGRSLAKDLNIEWKEFFPELDVFTNLSSLEGMGIFESYWRKRWAHESPYGPLPTYLDAVEPQALTLAAVSLKPPPHVNPLCHRANLLYSYHKQFLKAEIEVPKEDDVAYKVPSSSTELGPRSCGSNHDLYMNGCSLSEVDKEVYMSLMQDFSALVYPNTAKWKFRMADELHSESLKMGDDRNINEYDPMEPIPVPHPRDF